MLNPWNRFAMAVSATLTLLSPASGQTGQKPAPAKTASAAFDPHDLSGWWYRLSPFQTFSNERGGIPDALVPKNLPAYAEGPLTAAGKAKFDSCKPGYGPRAIPPALGNDPMDTCDPLGIPRNLNAEVESSHRLWRIAQLKDRFFQFFEWHHDWREVWTDGRPLPKMDELEPRWNGYSVGHWDGNTFIVDSIGFDDRTWLDKFGYPHTDEMKLRERYRRLDRDTLEFTMTLTDPEYYTKPWQSDRKIFKLNGGPIKKEWDEQIYCAPSEEYKFNQRIRDVAGGKSSK